ncbi:hypothetical protein GWI34_20985 [Actinomadura sp. DSM 109109]|nr:hypothetical protein [Actinomadura lepetitiana]
MDRMARAGDLKAELVGFAMSDRFGDALEELILDAFPDGVVNGESVFADVVEDFLFTTASRTDPGWWNCSPPHTLASTSRTPPWCSAGSTESRACSRSRSRTVTTASSLSTMWTN